METHENFCNISRSFHLRKRNVSDKIYRENQSTHFVFSNFFFLENLDIYDIMWKNIVEQSGPQMTIWRMHIACWIPKATDTKTRVVYYTLLFHCNVG